MSADFCFVAHAAETDPDKFSAQCVGNRLTETGFAHARRPKKTEDRAVSVRIEFAHRQIFDQPLFHLLQVVMIAIENFLRLVEIKIVLAQFVPGQISDDLDVTDDDREFRTCRRNKIESFQFPLDRFITSSGGLASSSRARNCWACSSPPLSASPSSRWIA